MTTAPRTADAVVVGAGFAGALTAAGLVARGFGRVVLVEQEAVPGFHGSGRNAAIARRVAEHPAVTALAARSVALMRGLNDASGAPVLRETGGVLLGPRDRLLALHAGIPVFSPEARALSEDAELTHLDALRERWPWLDAPEGYAALVTRGCGVVDIHGLLQTALAPLRGNLRLRSPVLAVRTTPAGAVEAVETAEGLIATPLLVNASGAGVNRLARLARARPLPFLPVRRHLLTTAPHATLPADAPWFWDLGRGFYLRREGPGLLLCACDETPWPDHLPDDPPRDPAIRELVAARFTASLPRLPPLAVARDWAGLRILTPDHAFVVGPDPEVRGLFWVAGLGGHGMTTACGVGELAADLLTGASPPPALVAAFAPGRFQR
jgi:D-arginine dehydrogenase